MKIPGKRVKLTQWLHGERCVVRVELEGVIPDEDQSEPSFEPKAVRFMDELQRLANEGKVDELAKHGEVYVRRAG